MNCQTREVGQTGLKVTDVSFGCASIGNLYREVSEVDAQATLGAAWDAGLRYFDTAPHYGRGLSETRLGAFLTEKPRDNFVVSTKVGRVLSPGAQQPEADGFINPLPNNVHYDYSGDGIEASLEGSRERLGLNQVEIVYVHDIGTFTHGASNAKHMEDFLGSGYPRLVRLKEQGKIRAIGLGVNENEICLDVMRHEALDVILLAGRLSLLDRSAEESLIPACDKAGTSLVLGGIFNSGILATGPVEGATYDYGPASQEILDQVADLQKRSEKLGISLTTAALHFAHRHRIASSVLLGTAKSGTLVHNLEALNSSIPKEFDVEFHA